MKLLLLLLPAVLLAQPALRTIVSPQSAQAGVPRTITFDVTGQATPVLTGLQFDETAPAGWTVGTPLAIGTALTAQKSPYCNSTAVRRCFMTGANFTTGATNNTVIANGGVATVTLTPPAAILPGTYTYRVAGVFGVNAANPPGVVTITAPVDLTITVAANPLDLTGDGNVTSADLQVIFQQFSSGTVGNADLNADGKVDLLDFARMIAALLMVP